MTLSRLPLLRLVRSRSAWINLAGWSALALASASVQQHRGLPHGADRALEFYAAIAVPLLVYGLVAAALGHQGLARSGTSLVRVGASPVSVARATVVVTMLTSALVCGTLGACVATWAHGSGDPPMMQDALQTFTFGALAGATYCAFLMMGAALVAASWGRVLLLLIDWLLAESDGLGAALTPRAHFHNLLGGDAPFEMAPWQSLAALALIAAICSIGAVRKAGRARP